MVSIAFKWLEVNFVHEEVTATTSGIEASDGARAQRMNATTSGTDERRRLRPVRTKIIPNATEISIP